MTTPPDPHEDCHRARWELQGELQGARSEIYFWRIASAFLLLLLIARSSNPLASLIGLFIILVVAPYSLSYLIGEAEAPKWLPRWFVRTIFGPVTMLFGLVALVWILLWALFWPMG